MSAASDVKDRAIQALAALELAQRLRGVGDPRAAEAEELARNILRRLIGCMVRKSPEQVRAEFQDSLDAAWRESMPAVLS